MLVHCRVTPSIKFAGNHLYVWVERDTVKVKCLAQVEEHNTMSPARTQTWTTQSRGEHTNHEATAPYNVHTINKKLIVPLNYNQNYKVLTESGVLEHGLGEHLKALE